MVEGTVIGGQGQRTKPKGRDQLPRRGPRAKLSARPQVGGALVHHEMGGGLTALACPPSQAFIGAIGWVLPPTPQKQGRKQAKEPRAYDPHNKPCIHTGAWGKIL